MHDRLRQRTVTSTDGSRHHAELPGILAWAVQRCLARRHEGLGQPTAVRRATQGYRDGSGSLAAFCDDCCLFREEASTPKAVFLDAFVHYSGQPITPRELSRRLKERGFIDGQVGAARTRSWRGVGMLDGAIAERDDRPTSAA